MMDKVLRKSADLTQFITAGRVINIDSRKKGVAGILSNLTHAPFVLDGVKYESFEGFWQSLKFPEEDPKKEEARKLYGKEARKIGEGITTELMHYNGRVLRVGSKELYELAKRAEKERFKQNPDQMKALLSTSNAKLVHYISLEDSKTLPRKMFCEILTKIREELKQSSP